MSHSTRKIFSKIGAGLMLGLSLFNLAAAWSRQAGSEMPKRIRQIRRREKEQIRPETQMIIEIAEQEGKAVIAQHQMHEETDVVIAQGRLTLPQMVIRFAALAVWGTTAGIFFTSMIFNIPFTLGKAVLSLLPGVAHTTVIKLDTESRYVGLDEKLMATVMINTNKDKVNHIKISFDYDPSAMRFDSFEITNPKIDRAKRIDNADGSFDLALESDKAAAYQNEKLLDLSFTPIKSEVTTTIAIDKGKSDVLTTKDGRVVDILGKTQSVTARIIPPVKVDVSCGRIDFDGMAEKEKWRDTVVGTPVAGEKRWMEVDVIRTIRCNYDQNNLYFIYSGLAYDDPEIFINRDGESVRISRTDSPYQWVEGRRVFVLLSLPTGSDKELPFHLKVNSDEKERWPAAGKAIMKLE